MTWEQARAAAVAVVVLAGGCFSDVDPSIGPADDDQGTTTDPSGTSGSTVEPPTSSTDTSGSTGVFDGTTGTTWADSSGSSGQPGQTSGPPPEQMRVELFPLACEGSTVWANNEGDVACGESGPGGEVVPFEQIGEHKKAIRVRPPGVIGDVFVHGRFSGVSLAGIADPVLRGQAVCPPDDKCETALVVRVVDPVLGDEDILTAELTGDDTVDLVLPLSAVTAEIVDVELRMAATLAGADAAAPPGLLWVDVHIDGA